MIGILIGLTISLAVICLASLSSAILMMWWNQDSGRRHSIGAASQTETAMTTMRETVSQTAEIVRLQTQMTEMLLLGRPIPTSSETPEPVRPSETLPTPDDLWQQLPATVRENLQREAEEEATWPSLSETLLEPSESEYQDQETEPLPL